MTFSAQTGPEPKPSPNDMKRQDCKPLLRREPTEIVLLIRAPVHNDAAPSSGAADL